MRIIDIGVSRQRSEGGLAQQANTVMNLVLASACILPELGLPNCAGPQGIIQLPKQAQTAIRDDLGTVKLPDEPEGQNPAENRPQNPHP